MVWNKSPEPPTGPEMPPSEPDRSARSSRLATLGPSIFLKGDLSGEEDLLIEGRLEGKITLPKHSVTVGSGGKVKADIHSKSICVEGDVRGNLFGSEEVVIRKTGRVRGNATAPRVTLENGAKFRGSIDMQPEGGKEAAAVDQDRPPKSSRPPDPLPKKKAGSGAEGAAASEKAGR